MSIFDQVKDLSKTGFSIVSIKLLFLFFSIIRMSSVFVLSILRLIDHLGDFEKPILINLFF